MRSELRLGTKWSALLWRVATTLVVIFGTGADVAAAQLSGGVQGNWGSSTELGLGARAMVGLDRLVEGLEAVVSFDFYFGGPEVGADMSAWVANVDAVYQFEGRSLTPYTGVGFNLTRFRVSTRALGVDLRGEETTNGVNFLAGLIFRTGRMRPFMEGRLVAGEQPQFVASAGVRF